ncbi:CBS domain-containing protein [Candidatus Woesearchaeota archaeon]|nr:CBS domain-containing protein [Candidatus Woesearchaeota archaeon]
MKDRKEYIVEKFMAKHVLTVSSDVTVTECAKAMARRKVSSAVITARGRIVGIVTENDISRKSVAAGLDAKSTKVSRIMSKDVVTIPPETPLYDAMIRLGQKRIKHLPVVKNGKLVGIITAMDMLRVQPAYIDILSYPLLQG